MFQCNDEDVHKTTTMTMVMTMMMVVTTLLLLMMMMMMMMMMMIVVFCHNSPVVLDGGVYVGHHCQQNNSECSFNKRDQPVYSVAARHTD